MKTVGSYKELYNSLPTVEFANSIVNQQADFRELLENIGKDIVSHNCQDVVGVRLLHKHNSIEDNELMIEVEEVVEGRQALSTVKTSGDVGYFTYVPNVWSCTANGDIVPLEYTDISCVSIDEDFFTDNGELFRSVSRRLAGHRLENLLGLTIISKPTFQFDGITHAAVEYSDIERDANIIIARRRDKLDRSRLIETTWDFSTSTMTSCTPSCYSYCVQYSPGHAIEHYSQHIFEDDSP